MIPGYPYFSDPKYEREKMYNNQAKKISSLMDELKLDNVHELFYVFCYLLHNGYFSIDKNYIYSTNITSEQFAIFLGSGCCRHDAKLLKEVLYFLKSENHKEEDCSVFLYNIKRKKVMDVDAREKEHQKSKEKLKLFNTSLYLPNHKVTLVYQNGLFLLDSTNLVEAQIINKKNSFSIHCPYGKYLLRKDSFLKQEIRDFCRFISMEGEKLESEDLEKYYEIAREICIKNKSLFDDFYNDSKKNYEDIKEYVLKNGK